MKYNEGKRRVLMSLQLGQPLALHGSTTALVPKGQLDCEAFVDTPQDQVILFNNFWEKRKTFKNAVLVKKQSAEARAIWSQGEMQKKTKQLSI